MNHKQKKVLLSLWMHSCAGRRHLAGVFRYIAEGRDWDIKLSRMGELGISDLNGVDGIITAPYIERNVLRTIERKSIPLVTLDIHEVSQTTGKKISCIFSDDYGVGVAMAKHVLSYGNFNTYGFAQKGSSPWACARQKGFLETLRNSNRQTTHIVLESEQAETEREHLLKSWLGDLPKPSVIMAATDELAIEILEMARSMRIRIPKDIAVVGTDDDELICEHTKPRLTSIRPGHEACGYAAAEELERLMRGKPPQTRLIPFESITDRKSLTVCVPAVHLIEAAKDFISKHACEGANVDDVAKALRISRRLLSLRFAECEGRTVHEALVNRRIEEVMRLLRTSENSITEITARCGFPSANYLKRLFKERTGKTMREWRCHDTPSNGQNGTKKQMR